MHQPANQCNAMTFSKFDAARSERRSLTAVWRWRITNSLGDTFAAAARDNANAWRSVKMDTFTGTTTHFLCALDLESAAWAGDFNSCTLSMIIFCHDSPDVYYLMLVIKRRTKTHSLTQSIFEWPNFNCLFMQLGNSFDYLTLKWHKIRIFHFKNTISYFHAALFSMK